ncbi:MAG: hypothetical protein V1742_12515, partial [Pseudomonadota bacterium]
MLVFRPLARQTLSWVFLGLLTIISLPGPAASVGLEAPPMHYLRGVEFAVTDLSGRPLPGVKADLNPAWGRVATPGKLLSDQSGLIRFQFEPVIENPMAGLLVRDVFLLYRMVFAYRLSKEGYLDLDGQMEDDQEFARMADPLYQGLNRDPTSKPLSLEFKLLTSEDLLAEPKKLERLQPLIGPLLVKGRTRNFSLIPHSLDLTSDGRLRLGLRFTLLFDPSDLGLAAAGAVLLSQTVRGCLEALSQASEGLEQVNTLEIQVLAEFQYRHAPLALPLSQTFVFRMPQ